jgi:ribosome biogenesis protein Nip4
MFRELSKRERTKLNSFLSYWNIFGYFKDKVLVIRNKDVFMINNMKEFVLNNDPVFAGIKVCTIRKHVHLSLSILHIFVNNNCSKKVMINDHAEQLFLYGKDIFGSSIVWHTNDFRANDEVIIINRYNEPLGIGKVRYDCNDNKLYSKGIVIDNIKDLGSYLRDESLPLDEIDSNITKI